jgi:hypothetical protein
MNNTNNPSTSLFPSPNDQSTSFFQHQRNSSQQFDPGQNQLFEDFLTPPPSYQPLTNDSASSSSFPNLHHNTTDPY